MSCDIFKHIHITLVKLVVGTLMCIRSCYSGSAPTGLLDAFMKTSSNWNIFRVTGPLWEESIGAVCGESTGDRWIPHTKASDSELKCLHLNKRLSKQSRRRWFETPSRSLWRQGDVVVKSATFQQHSISNQPCILTPLSQCQLTTLNTLWPSDVIWRYRTGSTLAQVMACCLTAPSHYLNQCWLSSVKFCGIQLMALSLEDL